MTTAEARVTIHMVASLDGFIARKDGSVDWLETSDRYEAGVELTDEEIAAFLKSVDCYMLGARTYETALGFEAKGFGWAYGGTPVFVLTHRDLPKTRDSVHFRSGDLARLVNGELRQNYRNIWVGGGGAVAGACLRLGLADEVRVTMAPVLIGDGITFFGAVGEDIALHLVEAKAYKSGMVALRHEVRKA
jgi:dihydrofolate reductase